MTIRKRSRFHSLMVLFLVTLVVPAIAQQPEYEPAYVDGKTVTINVIFFNQLHAPPRAQADFFLVVYPWQPIGWQDLGLDPSVTLAYAAHLPAKSEADVEALLASTLPDGSPIAVEVDTDFYFLCSVVNSHAGR
ncbi:MAG TPA: hypothetical protein VFB21_20580 [Chthonomonadaceae bacterium]|nr:hypothetical protein [Chthonomonadaceae bacterium]